MAPSAPTPKLAYKDRDPAEMSLGDHLEELRRRLILAMIGIVPLLIAALVFGKPLLALLIGPLRDELRQASQPSGLLATGPFETFAVYMQISLIATVIVGSPWILYHLWKFIEPGLYSNERSFVHILVPLSTILTLSSALFLYFVILPVILAFFINFGTQLGQDSTPIVQVGEGIVLPSLPVLAGDPPDPQLGEQWINTDLMQMRTVVPKRDGSLATIGAELVAGAGITQQYRVSEYIKTVLNLALAFGIGFQTPVVVLLLGWAGIVTRQTLAKYRKYAVAVCVVAGAVLTPADPLSMMLLAIPLYILFELGMLLLIVFPPNWGRPRTEEQDGREPDGDADEDTDGITGDGPPPLDSMLDDEEEDGEEDRPRRDIFDETVDDETNDDFGDDPNAYDDPPPPPSGGRDTDLGDANPDGGDPDDADGSDPDKDGRA